MPWFNVDDGFANSKPVLRIPRRYRCQAIGLWTLAGSWSAKELTDGFIPDHALEEFASNAAIATHLVKAGLWSQVVGGWQFEGWDKWQKTKEQVLAFRAAEAERKRNARSRNKPTSESVESYSDRDPILNESCESQAGQPQSENLKSSRLKSPGRQSVSGVDAARTESGVPLGHHPESGQPLPIPKPSPDPLSLVTLSGGVASVGARENPRPNCPDHEENFDGPCRRCQKRREWDETHESRLAADELERKRVTRSVAAQALANCTLCDPGGWVLGADGEPLEPAVKCKAHEAVAQ